MRQGKHRSGVVLTCAIVAIISFVLGARMEAIIQSLASSFGVRTSTATLDLSSVQETYRALRANYDGDVDDQALIDGANAGLVAALGDPHTAYLNREAAEELQKEMSGSIGGGIGAEIGMRQERPTIIRPLKDSPAEKAGLRAGDVIVAVNDQGVAMQSLERVIGQIRGEIGTTVKLLVMRGQVRQEVSIVRSEVTSPTVEAMIEGKTGVLIVRRFNSETGRLARAEAEKFLAGGVEKVILDLRGNPGGEVTAAQSLAGLWLDRQVLLTHRRAGQITQTDKTTGRPLLAGTKTIVLINGGSASASEIVAGALKEYDKATLVGEKTYGKGSVQLLRHLSGGAQLKVTESRWFTPQGNTIDKEGIQPDVAVELTADDVEHDRDPQLEKAKTL